MGINWTVRIKNKAFWLAIIPAVLMLVRSIAAVFGYALDFTDLKQLLLSVVESVFVVLAILGIVNDPTTKGISDSARAMRYTEPNDDIAGLR